MQKLLLAFEDHLAWRVYVAEDRERHSKERARGLIDPCGVQHESVFEAMPPLKLSEVTLLERKLAIILR